MRIFAILAALTTAAAADPAHDVEALVRTLVGNLHDHDKLARVLRPDAIYTVGITTAHDATPDDVSTFSGAFAILSIGKISVTFDPRRHAAWFQGVAGAITVDQSGDSCRSGHCSPQVEFRMHISGLALDDHGWKLAAVVLTESAGDGWFVNRDTASESPSELTGDAKLAADAATWVSMGLARSAAPAFVYVAGTAPGEVASGAASKRLVDKWDAMKLTVTKLDAATFGDTGIVLADVRWADRTHVMAMRLAAIAVRHGDRWLWVVLALA